MLIPDEFIDRPKQGFGVPVFEWYQDRLGELIKKDVSAFCEQTDFLDGREVQRVLASGDGSMAWTLHNLAMWHREFVA